MSVQPNDADMDAARNLYKDFKIETEKRQISSSENLDKSILTYSSWMLGVSIAFLKDFIPINLAYASWCLYTSWIFFAYSISSTTLSFLLSYTGLSLSLQHANKYYLEGDDAYFNKDNIWNKVVRCINWSSGISFVLGIIFTTMFVSCNLEKSAMEKNRKLTYDGMPASLMSKRQEGGAMTEKKGLPSPAMQKIPAPSTTETPRSSSGPATPATSGTPPATGS